MRFFLSLTTGTSVCLAAACGFGEPGPSTVPSTLAPSTLTPPTAIPSPGGHQAKFLALSDIPRGCRIDFAELTQQRVEMLHPVAELPFLCDDVHIEADSTGRSLAIINTTALAPVVVLREGVSSEVTLPGGARPLSVGWEGTGIAVFSTVSIDPIRVDENGLPSGQGKQRRVDYGGHSYIDEFEGETIGCVVHRPPSWEPTEFRLVAIDEAGARPYCGKETGDPRFFGSWTVGVGRAEERTQLSPPAGSAVPGPGNRDHAVVAADPGGAWVWSSPLDDQGTAMGPLRVWARGAAAWSHTDIPFSAHPIVRPPLVCGERGLVLAMVGTTASAHAHLVWSSPHCARPWPDDLAAPTPWQGLAEAPPPVHVAPPPPPPLEAVLPSSELSSPSPETPDKPAPPNDAAPPNDPTPPNDPIPPPAPTP